MNNYWLKRYCQRAINNLLPTGYYLAWAKLIDLPDTTVLTISSPHYQIKTLFTDETSDEEVLAAIRDMVQRLQTYEMQA